MQTGKGRTPAEREPGSGQLGLKSLLPNHKGTGSPEEEGGEGVSSENSSPPHSPLPVRDLVPQGLATPLGCGEGHKWRL